MLVKNVLSHPDDLHDGRPIGPYETVEVSADAAEMPHYQSRFADGLMVVVPAPESSSGKPKEKAPKTASGDASKENS